MTDEKTSWSTVRASIGIMQGRPADAIADTDALHDEPPRAPAGFRFTPMPDDVLPWHLVCSYTYLTGLR